MFNQITTAGRLRDSFSRHRWLFLLSLLLISGITTGAVLLRTKTFKATASTQVVTDNQQAAEALGENYRFVYKSSAQQHVDHFTDLINDDLPGGFWDTALKNANLATPINIDPRVKDTRFALLRKRLYANADSNTMFSIILTWDNPAECERIVESLQKQYSDEVGQEQQIKSVNTTSFLQKEIADYETRLQKAEEAVTSYKQAHSGLMPAAQDAEEENLSALKASRDDLIIRANDGTLRIKEYEEQLAKTPPKIMFEQTLNNSPSAQAVNQLGAQRITLLAQGIQPTAQQIKNIDVQIAAAQKRSADERAQMAQAATGNPKGTSGNTNVSQTKVQENPRYAELSGQLVQARIEQQSATQQLKNTEARVRQYESVKAALPAQERELTTRTRDYDILKKHYTDLKDRLEAARIKAQLDKVTASATLIPVGSVYAASTQGQAKTLLMLLGSLLLGLVVATGMVVFSEWNDQTLRYPTDVERLLELPVLASVPESSAIDTSQTGGTSYSPDALPEGTPSPGVRFGKNPGGLAARNPSMGTFGP